MMLLILYGWKCQKNSCGWLSGKGDCDFEVGVLGNLDGGRVNRDKYSGVIGTG